MEQATDVSALTAELETVENQLRQLTTSSFTRYDTQQNRDELRSQLDSSTAHKDQLQSDVAGLRLYESLLRTAVEAATDYVNIQLPSHTLGDAVIRALNMHRHTDHGIN